MFVLALLIGLLAAPAAANPGKGNRPAVPPGQRVDVQLLAFNDFHGHLEPTSPGPLVSGGPNVGGAEYLATHLDLLRAGNKNSFTVSAGDIIGGTPFISGLFRDEPAVEAVNALGLDVSTVGNHEFDAGIEELLRHQNGGCHPDEGCFFPDQPYQGADFPWLAANVVNDATGETVLPPYWIRKVQSVNIAFIGITLEGTSSLVSPSGIEGWSFTDEVATANALVPELRRKGAEAIVLLLHEGGTHTGTFNECRNLSGPVVDIAERVDPAIDVIVTGHTHQGYNCEVTDPAGEPRRVTSAASAGRLVTEITFQLDKRSNDVVRSTVAATNHVVTQDVPRSPALTAVVEKWRPLADERGAVPVGSVTATLARARTASGSEDRGAESSISNLIADAQRSVTGADLALMNPGGVRADLTFASSARGEGDGVVTYAEAYAVQPFQNILVTVPMTGQQIVQVLQEQCQPASFSRRFLHLGVSDGFTYDLSRTFAANGTCTATISNAVLNGQPLDLARTYTVAVNNFLAEGGDNFFTFRQITPDRWTAWGGDLEALIQYLDANSPISPPSASRVTKLN